MKPQRAQRRTLCPQKDFFKAIIERQRCLWDRLFGRKGSHYPSESCKEIQGNNHFFNSLRIKIFSVSSVVIF